MNRFPTLTALRVALVLFVLVWIFGPYELRSSVPIWIPFAIALGLELNFLVGALRPAAGRRPDRGPQEVDRERYGYAVEEEEADAGLEPGRQRMGLRRFLVGLGLLGVLALVLWAVDTRTGWNALDSEARIDAQARFSQEASEIAGKTVTISCDEAREFVGAVQHADGVAIVGGDLAYLTPEICLDLYRLAFEAEVAGSRTARALAVLAHEAWHLRGLRDEGTVECYALQTGVALGGRLGLSEETARRLMRQQLAENALRTGASFEYLVPAECRDGGRLDLRPESDRFP